MSRLSRLLRRPSSKLVRSIILPLAAIHAAVTVYVLVVAAGTSRNLAYDRVEGIAQAVAMTEAPSADMLRRLGDWIGADRLWVVSATGRILASNRPSEVDALVDDVWWQELPHEARRVGRETEWGGRDYAQVAYHDIERGVWSMVIADADDRILQGSARTGAILLLGVAVWLLAAGVVAVVVSRTLGKPMDLSDLVARRALSGEPTSTASLARVRAAAKKFEPAARLLHLVERMQERATRANEAESRFAHAVELLPGIAYLASYDGTLLYAGPVMRQRLGSEAAVGRPVIESVPELPLDRVHTAAGQSLTRGVSFDNLPVREESDEGPAMVASVRSVQFRGAAAYLAHLEAVNDQGHPEREDIPLTVDRQLVDGSGEIVIAFDGATRTLVWNARAVQLTGVIQDDVPDLRSAIERLFRGDKAMSAFADWMDQGPEAAPLEIEFEAVDGTSYRVSWTARELAIDGRTVGGALFGIVQPLGAVRDRIARKRRRVRPRRGRDINQQSSSEEPASGASSDTDG